MGARAEEPSSLGHGSAERPGERECACVQSSREAEAGRCFLSAVCSRSQSIKKGGALETQGLLSAQALEMHRDGFGSTETMVMRRETNCWFCRE